MSDADDKFMKDLGRGLTVVAVGCIATVLMVATFKLCTWLIG